MTARNTKFVQLGQFASHFQTCLQGAVGLFVAVLADRHSPESHDRVADVFIDDSAVAANDGHHSGHVLVQENNDFFWRHGLRHRREPANVAEENGRVFSFAAELNFAGEKFFHDLFIVEFVEGGLHSVTLFKPQGHFIK